MTSARIVPMVAVAVPRITVFLIASWVDDSSVNTKTMLCSVKVDGVTGVVALGENAALSSARYGRNTGHSSTSRQNSSAGQRHCCHLDPPRRAIFAADHRIAASAEEELSGPAAAGSVSSKQRHRGGGGQFELGRILEQAPDLGGHGVEAGRQRQDRRRAEQRHRLKERDHRAGDQRGQRQREW